MPIPHPTKSDSTAVLRDGPTDARQGRVGRVYCFTLGDRPALQWSHRLPGPVRFTIAGKHGSWCRSPCSTADTASAFGRETYPPPNRCLFADLAGLALNLTGCQRSSLSDGNPPHPRTSHKSTSHKRASIAIVIVAARLGDQRQKRPRDGRLAISMMSCSPRNGEKPSMSQVVGTNEYSWFLSKSSQLHHAGRSVLQRGISSLQNAYFVQHVVQMVWPSSNIFPPGGPRRRRQLTFASSQRRFHYFSPFSRMGSTIQHGQALHAISWATNQATTSSPSADQITDDRFRGG